MAEQQRPIRRKVALKIIKPGMDSTAVVARFDAERQALAMMDHPNIARVFDGGATDSGRPYFVMELVKGVPLTEYCDRNGLSTEKRLELFGSVCQAVQHAHQKGIIHRDLKPSNILTTLHDGQPVVKVIDFGISKAINQQLTEKTLFTAYGQMIGTPQYMSPEQAEMSGLDVDTRSDVYSLGVVLYELLTGTTPLEASRLRAAGYAELQRLIRDEEPPRPSARLSTSGDALTVIAKHRSASPDKLTNLVRGDLDWIAMKSLEKDRHRRYPSPNHLLDDLTRYLQNEPVDARPPTLRYKVTKYVRRNRYALLTTSLVFLLLVLGLAGTTWQAEVARLESREKEDALQEKEDALHLVRSEVLDRALESAIRGDQLELRTLLAKAKSLGIPAEWVQFLNGLEKFYQGDIPGARSEFENSVATQSKNPAAVAMSSICSLWLTDVSAAQRSLSQLASLQDRTEYEKSDAIFRAFANLYRSPEDARVALRQLLDDQPFSVTTRLFYAGSLAHVALISGADELPLRALDEMDIVQRLAGDSPVVALFHLFCITVAISESNVSVEGLEKLTSKAARLRTSKFPQMDFALWNAVQAQYLESIGEPEEAIKQWGDAAARGVYPDAYFWCAMRQRDRVPGRDEVKRLSLFSQACLAAESRERRKEVIKRCSRDAIEPLSNDEQIGAIMALLLLGELSAAQSASEVFNEQDSAGVYLTYPNPRRYLLGEESEDDFLKRCGDSRLERLEAYFEIGMKQFAVGDRRRAIESFNRCVEQGQINGQAHYISRSLRDRLLQDREWPSWIEPSQEGAR